MICICLRCDVGAMPSTDNQWMFAHEGEDRVQFRGFPITNESGDFIWRDGGLYACMCMCIILNIHMSTTKLLINNRFTIMGTARRPLCLSHIPLTW